MRFADRHCSMARHSSSPSNSCRWASRWTERTCTASANATATWCSTPRKAGEWPLFGTPTARPALYAHRTATSLTLSSPINTLVLLWSTRVHCVLQIDAANFGGGNLYGAHPFALVMNDQGSSTGIAFLNSNAMRTRLRTLLIAWLQYTASSGLICLSLAICKLLSIFECPLIKRCVDKSYEKCFVILKLWQECVIHSKLFPKALIVMLRTPFGNLEIMMSHQLVYDSILSNVTDCNDSRLPLYSLRDNQKK